jgi:RNA polymerase sigma-70 factor (ECF subfamily)
MESRPDEQLMLDARNGDLRKIGTLFERHQTPLFNYYLRMTGDRAASEDLVQDVFFRILRSRHTYKDGQPFVAWMYHIARNARLDRIRKTSREVALDSRHDSPADGRTAAEHAEARQDVDLLRRALAELPEDRREVLILSRYQNLKYDEIARLLDCEVGAVKVRVYRAIRELREIYSELTGRKPS